MDGTLVTLLGFGLLFGGALLALVMGYTDIESRRQSEKTAHDAALANMMRDIRDMPRFFAQLDGNAQPDASKAIDDALVAELEGYLKAEQAVAEMFVAEPSVANLYRQAGRPAWSGDENLRAN